MDAHKAVELGFADGILGRADLPRMSSRQQSPCCIPRRCGEFLMDKIAAKCATKPKTESAGRSVDSLYERLDLLKN